MLYLIPIIESWNKVFSEIISRTLIPPVLYRIVSSVIYDTAPVPLLDLLSLHCCSFRHSQTLSKSLLTAPFTYLPVSFPAHSFIPPSSFIWYHILSPIENNSCSIIIRKSKAVNSYTRSCKPWSVKPMPNL